jgi:eukaryotic-like serine/threonine-protein kinase
VKTRPTGGDALPPTEWAGTSEPTTSDDTLTQPSVPAPALPPGVRIGPYVVERELGSGGMGAVYLAHRADETFEKRVAIKLIRAALATGDAVLRFKRERRILARLEHPNIARILDAGTTEDGLPYFVMEYIEGRPIHAWCDEHRLDTARRLRLFLGVCSAVEYAHHNLIVHRDIKPGNILVTGEGVPRLLDFGIAKLVGADAGDEVTQATALAFTPWYASPEQIQGEPMSTATDVYSLGVLLYELLTGHGPYRIASLRPLEVMRAIVEQEPELPSAAVDRTARVTTRDAPENAALTPWMMSRTREASPQRLRQRLKGDLDAILMTALRKDPARRYPSVEAFAEDIRAYLAQRPVSARRDSALYRAAKFVRRNRWGILAAAAVAAVGIAAGASYVVQSRRVARERDRAERVSRFLTDLFRVSNPGEARGSSVTAREVLDKGAAEIESELKEEPEVRAELMDTMAGVYDNLGLYEQAARLARESLDFRRKVAGREPAALARTLNHLGNILMDKGDLPAAETAYREALELRRPLHGNESPEVAESLNNLAGVLSELGRYPESEKLLLESLAVKRKLLGGDDARVATTVLNLGVVRYKQGDIAGSEKYLREALALQRKSLGDDHPDVAFTMQALGVLLDERGRYPEAEKTLRDALALQRRLLGPEHPDVATTITNLGNTLLHAGRVADADAAYAEALPLARKAFGEDTTDVAAILAGQAEAAERRGRLAEGERLARQSLEIREKRLGKEHADTADSLVILGRIVAASGRLAEAEEPLLRAVAIVEAQKGLEAKRRDARAALVRLYEKWGRPEDAARFRGSETVGPDVKTTAPS